MKSLVLAVGLLFLVGCGGGNGDDSIVKLSSASTKNYKSTCYSVGGYYTDIIRFQYKTVICEMDDTSHVTTFYFFPDEDIEDELLPLFEKYLIDNDLYDYYVENIRQIEDVNLESHPTDWLEYKKFDRKEFPDIFSTNINWGVISSRWRSNKIEEYDSW